ncbi:sigma-70 family RNA polymerase sigma factor [Alteromonas ponticola]|uniref:Sigma-70 family RNA polymerase sigma factor n=1 Tax=Alteromonas aquimaris TaxID=2998417 RepID=A0ABT3P337_9ALTE|nr:sigma-70 family RNA polymerase sigma factor [Alteromonas aquimaris]MCW8107180.1 sigma-70 family RNA polymerase sigma factor [Alteromonas aquimaris]
MNRPQNIESILTEYAPLVARIAASHESNAARREELIQDVSLAVWRGLESFRGEASIKTFVARVAHNRCVDHVLSEQRHHQLLFDEKAYAQASEPCANTDSQLDLFSALQKLPLAYRQVMVMQLEGFTQNEIGDVLGINEAAVSQRVRRARMQLEKLL